MAGNLLIQKDTTPQAAGLWRGAVEWRSTDRSRDSRKVNFGSTVWLVVSAYANPIATTSRMEGSRMAETPLSIPHLHIYYPTRVLRMSDSLQSQVLYGSQK